MTPYWSATVEPLTAGQLKGAIDVLTARLVVEDGEEVVDDGIPSAELEMLDVLDENSLEVIVGRDKDTLLEADEAELLAVELVMVVDGTVQTRLVEIGSALPLS